MKVGLSSFLQSQPNVFIYQRFGWRFTFYYTIVLGGLYLLFNRRDQRKIKEGIHFVFPNLKNQSDRKSIILAVFKGIILHYYEKIFNAFSSAETLKTFFKTHVKNEGMTAIQQGLAKGHGVLFVTGHFGGVEFIPLYLAANNYPTTIIVRFASDILRNISIQKAKEFSTRIIDVDHSPNIVKSIADNLRENRIVITQCDEIHEWKTSKRIRASFLGKDIYLDRTLDTLIRRMNPTIVFGIMHRESDNRFKLIISSRGEMVKDHMRLEKFPVSRVALSFLEQYIYRYPREWYQWKQYAEFLTAPPFGMKAGSPSSLSLLKTSLDNIS